MSVLVSGSLAYDRIMDFPGNFVDHIVPEKAHVLSISFVVNGMVEKFGGTAGNIAYGLSLLGEKPLILSSIGKDYDRYFDWLKSHNLSTEGIRIVEDEFTAGAYITTDKADNQITGFNPGAMKYPSDFGLDNVDLRDAFAIVAPGNVQDMMNYSSMYKKKSVPYIFDPGQAIPVMSAEQLIGGIHGARVLIANDYEMELILRKTGKTLVEMLELVDAVIGTKGERGSVIYTRDGEVEVPAVRPQSVVDPTGAGDAYRAGLVKGLVDGKCLETAARMGSVCASYAVETYGTQEYSFTVQGFWERYEGQFGRPPRVHR